MTRIRLAALGLLLIPGVASAQTFTIGASRWFNSPHTSEYRVGVGGFGKGLFRLVVLGAIREAIGRQQGALVRRRG